VLRDVAVHHPQPRVRRVHQHVHDLAGPHQYRVEIAPFYVCHTVTVWNILGGYRYETSCP
jgi:hypothetical protein